MEGEGKKMSALSERYSQWKKAGNSTLRRIAFSEEARVRNSPYFYDLDEIMSVIDFESTMARLGIEVERVDASGEWRGYCPDHEKYKGVRPSDPKWYVNEHTGLTYCQTEGRGSNIVEVAMNVWGMKYPAEAAEALKNGKVLSIRGAIERRASASERAEVDEEELKKRLERSVSSVERVLEDGLLTQRALEYFSRDGISRETLDKFGVSECTSGKYAGRAIVPFLGDGLETVGFIAIDLIGKDRRPEMEAESLVRLDSGLDFGETLEYCRKNYRKTLYASGFVGRRHLYGFYENVGFSKSRPRDLMVVEGERDCMKMMQEGIPCVSVHGTSVKDEQIALLKKTGVLGGIERLFLGFDMDEAGNKAVEKAFARFSSEMDADRIYSLDFPDGKDPKKFNGDEIRTFMEESVIKCRRSRK